MNLNIFPDLEGRILTFEKLLAKMPNGQVMGLGDINDRGPSTCNLIDLFIQRKYKSLRGNHENLLLSYYEEIVKNGFFDYIHDLYGGKNTGGSETLQSYGINLMDRSLIEQSIKSNPKLKEHINWIKSLPYYETHDSLILTHAPLQPGSVLINGEVFVDGKVDKDCNWNTNYPALIENKIQIFGHISLNKVTAYTPKNPQGVEVEIIPSDAFAIGLETMKSGVMSAIHFPSMKIYTQEVID